MASLQTIAKGVYVIKPDMQATQAEDYVDLYNRARGQQLQIAMETVAQEAKQKQLTFEQEMMAYRKQLELLAKQKQELLEQRATLSYNLEKYNAEKRTDSQKFNADLANEFKTNTAEQQVLSAGRVVTPDAGAGEGARAEKLTPEEDAALKGVRSQAAASPVGNLTQALVETTSSQIAGTGPLAATSPGKAQRVRAGAVQESINAKMQEGLSEDAAIRAVAGDLKQLGAKGEEFINAWDALYGAVPTAKPVVSGGSYQRPKYKGLQAPEELTPEQISGEESIGMIDRELAELRVQMDALGIPRLEQIDSLERARQIREERFKGSVVSEAQKKQKAKAADTELMSAFESTPQGYIASRVDGGKRLISSQNEFNGLIASEEGSIVESLYSGNSATSKTTEEAMKKTWDEVSSMLSSDPSKMRKSHELLVALHEKALGKKNPSKAVEIETVSQMATTPSEPTLYLGETEIIAGG